MTTTQTTFAVDTKTAQALDELKEEFAVNTNAAVIRRALALARILVKDADNHVLTVVGKDGEKHKILLTA